MQTVTLHTNKCFNLYHISLINVTLCSSYCQYFQFLPLGGVPLQYICINNNPVTPTQLNNITTHVTYKLYSVYNDWSFPPVISYCHCISYTIIFKRHYISSMPFSISTRLHLLYNCAILPLLYDSSNADIDTGASQKEQMPR